MDKFAKDKLQPKTVCGDSPLIRQTKSAYVPTTPLVTTPAQLTQKPLQKPLHKPEMPATEPALQDQTKKKEEEETNGTPNCSFPTERLMHSVGGSGDYESSPCAVAAWAAAAAAWLAARALLAVTRSLLPYVRQIAGLCRCKFDEVWANDKAKHREMLLILHGSLTFFSYLILGSIYSVYIITEWFVEPSSSKKLTTREAVEVIETVVDRTPSNNDL